MNNCRKISKILAQMKVLQSDFEIARKNDLIEEAQKLAKRFEEINESTIEIRLEAGLEIDPDKELEIRDRIGKKHGFSSVDQFSCGVARAFRDREVCFVRPDGELLFEKPFRDASWFGEGGYAAVCEKDGAFVIIDKTGKRFKEEEYLSASQFHDGLSKVKKADEKWYFLQLDGKEFPGGDGFDEVRDFSEGLCAVLKDNFWSFVNREGEVVQGQGENKFLDLWRGFHDGRAVVKMNDGLLYYIDQNFEKVIERGFDRALDFRDGLACVQEVDHDSWIFIDKDGKQISDVLSESAWFSDGVAFIRPVNGRAMMVDRNFREIFHNTQYSEFRSFHDGLGSAKRKSDGRWVIIDKSGKAVIDQDFEFAATRDDVTIMVSDILPDKRDNFYIDKSGKRLFGKKQD